MKWMKRDETRRIALYTYNWLAWMSAGSFRKSWWTWSACALAPCLCLCLCRRRNASWPMTMASDCRSLEARSSMRLLRPLLVLDWLMMMTTTTATRMTAMLIWAQFLRSLQRSASRARPTRRRTFAAAASRVAGRRRQAFALSYSRCCWLLLSTFGRDRTWRSCRGRSSWSAPAWLPLVCERTRPAAAKVAAVVSFLAFAGRRMWLTTRTMIARRT